MKKEYRKMVRKVNGKIREIKEGQGTIEVPLPMAASARSGVRSCILQCTE